MKLLSISSLLLVATRGTTADQSCPETYDYLLPSCSADTKKSSDCASWSSGGTTCCPNLRPYLPHQFQIKKIDGKDYLRYTGGMANLPDEGTGGGTFEIIGEQNLRFDTEFCNSVIPEEERYYENAVDCQETYQNLYQCGENGIKGDTPVLSESTGSWAFYHATHKHWHASNLYEYTLHSVEYDIVTNKPRPSVEPLARSNKVTFCLIDWVAAIKNNGNNGNENGDNQLKYYFDCESHTSKLGISAGFMDQYHQSLDGMAFDMSEILDFLQLEECVEFFVVVTANGQCTYWESNYDDNVAYRGVRICKKGNGNSYNWKVDAIGDDYDSNTCCWDPDGGDVELYQPHLCGKEISNH